MSPADDFNTRVRLVEHVVENVRARFQARGPLYGEVHEDMPENLFPAGTLYPGDATDVVAELESEFAKTEYTPSSMGFAIRTKRRDELHVKLGASFSLYYPVHPSWRDVEAFLEQFDQGAATVKMPPKFRRAAVRIGPLDLTIPLVDSGGFQEHPDAARALSTAVDRATNAALGDPDLYGVAFNERVKTKARLYPRREVADAQAWQTRVASCTRRVEAGWHATLYYRVRELDDESFLVEFFLCNLTPESNWGVHETAFIGPCLRVSAKEPDVATIALPEIEARDYRHEAWTWAAGRNCDTKVQLVDGWVHVETESLPLYVQHRIATRDWEDDGTPIDSSFRALAGDGALTHLRALGRSMRRYLEDWDSLAARSPNPGEAAQIAAGRALFEQEVQRFERGVEILAAPGNADVLNAFRLMNESFARRFDHAARARELRTGRARAPNQRDGWRLFQLVFIVSELEDLLHRDRARGRPETPSPTVLWFPTGGGKTEAYLGLVVLHAFWDRLRGKPYGVTAFAKFPLRMLSLQQFSRVVDVVEHADDVRRESDLLEGARGEPFSVGYYAGGDNTLNVLDFPVSPDRAEKRSGWTSDANQRVGNPSKLAGEERKHNKVTRCPVCLDANGVAGTVQTTFDPDKPGFRHVCNRCGRELNLHLTDTEVLRRLPTLVIATIDKLARFATEPWGRTIFGEAGAKCPRHGYLLGRPLRRDGSKDDRCPVLSCAETLVDPEPNVDPVPGLLVQDELHLLTETLGAFASHYETMLIEAARVRERAGVGRGPWKIVGSTATIEGYQALVRQLYNHGTSRRFPVPGPLRTESFYARETDEPQRYVLGVRGHGMSHVDSVMKVLLEWHRVTVPLAELRSCRAGTQLEAPLAGIADEQRVKLARRYRTPVTYGIQRNEVMQVNNSYTLQLNAYMERLGYPTFDSGRIWNLTGDSNVERLQEFLERMENGNDSDYPQAATATNLISHGVDLDDLNAMVFRGMPHTMSEYIQAMSRVGRAREVPSLVVNVYNPNRERDGAFFESHAKYMELRDVMVRHVPTTRFSRQALDKTVPGLVLHYVNYERPPYNLWRRTTVDGLLAEVRDNHAEIVEAVKRRLGLDSAPDPDSPLVRRQARDIENELVARVRWKLQQRSTDPNESQYATERLGALRSLRDTDATIKIYSEGNLEGGAD